MSADETVTNNEDLMFLLDELFLKQDELCDMINYMKRFLDDEGAMREASFLLNHLNEEIKLIKNLIEECIDSYWQHLELSLFNEII